jgi:uncharacterized membrane protein HdeD (DUF308 family)
VARTRLAVKEAEMANSISGDIHRAANWSIVLSVLMIVVGLLAMWVPGISGIAVTAIVGWLLIFSGILHLVFAWRGGGAGTVIWEILVGIVYGVIGFYLLTRPLVGLATLTFALALYLLFEGILELVMSAQFRGAGRGWLVLDGVITLLLAIVIWMGWPGNSIWVLGFIVGISMLFSGISRLMLSLAVRRITA